MRLLSLLATAILIAGCSSTPAADGEPSATKQALQKVDGALDAGCTLASVVGGPSAIALCALAKQAVTVGMAFSAPTPEDMRNRVALCAETVEGRETPEWQAVCADIYTDEIDALLRAWTPVRADLAAQFPNAVMPEFVLFDDKTISACGEVSAIVYCGLDRTIFLKLPQVGTYPASQATTVLYLVGHEAGHFATDTQHIENLVAYGSTLEASQLVELSADSEYFGGFLCRVGFEDISPWLDLARTIGGSASLPHGDGNMRANAISAGYENEGCAA